MKVKTHFNFLLTAPGEFFASKLDDGTIGGVDGVVAVDPEE